MTYMHRYGNKMQWWICCYGDRLCHHGCRLAVMHMYTMVTMYMSTIVREITKNYSRHPSFIKTRVLPSSDVSTIICVHLQIQSMCCVLCSGYHFVIWVIISSILSYQLLCPTRPYAIKCDTAVTVVLIIYLHIKAHT